MTDISALAARCAEEQSRYAEGINVHSHDCFDLFRHALQEQNSAAFNAIYRTYEPQVRRWVYQHSHYPAAQEEADHFVQQSLTKFYFALRGRDFDRFEHISQVMQYLKLCVHSAIMQYWRKTQSRRMHQVDDESSLLNVAVSPNFLTPLAAWERIATLLPEARDQRLAHAAFAQGLKPSEIVEEFPDDWEDVQQIYSKLYRIRRVLRDDEELRTILSVSER